MRRAFEAVYCARALFDGGVSDTLVLVLTMILSSTAGGRRWRSDDQLGESAQVLCDGRERKLVLRTTWTTQSEATKLQDALEMSE